jgi:protein tyrosine/serine phosphatase
MRVRIRWLRWTLLLFGLLAAVILWDYAVQKNFEAVVPGKLYRSGQPREGQLEEWIREYKLRSILSLRGSIPPHERQLADGHGLKLYHVPFTAVNGMRPGQWDEIRSIMTDESNLPLLVHCHGGGDRTGMVTALYRVEVQGWPLEKAIREMNYNYHVSLRYPVLQKQLRAHFQGELEDSSPQVAE